MINHHIVDASLHPHSRIARLTRRPTTADLPSTGSSGPLWSGCPRRSRAISPVCLTHANPVAYRPHRRRRCQGRGSHSAVQMLPVVSPRLKNNLFRLTESSRNASHGFINDRLALWE